MTATLPRSRYRRDGGHVSAPHTAKIYADLARVIGGTPKSCEHRVEIALAVLANLIDVAAKHGHEDWLEFRLAKLLIAAKQAGHPLQFTPKLCAQVNRSDLSENAALGDYLASPDAEHRTALRREAVRDLADTEELVASIDAMERA